MSPRPKFRPDSQDEARRRGHGADKVHVQNAAHLKSLDRQRVQTAPGKVTWIVDGGDHLTLRGIPAIGRGVSGAVFGSRPESVIDR